MHPLRCRAYVVHSPPPPRRLANVLLIKAVVTARPDKSIVEYQLGFHEALGKWAGDAAAAACVAIMGRLLQYSDYIGAERAVHGA